MGKNYCSTSFLDSIASVAVGDDNTLPFWIFCMIFRDCYKRILLGSKDREIAGSGIYK